VLVARDSGIGKENVREEEKDLVPEQLLNCKTVNEGDLGNPP